MRRILALMAVLIFGLVIEQQDATIAQQRALILKMTRNPACMVDKPHGRIITDN